MHRILTVDDEEAIGKIVMRLLDGEGYEVKVATTGREALAKVSLSPDLVLLDLNLPDMDGIDVMREMKRMNGAIPVVMMTAYGSIGSAVQAIKSGAVDYIEKPFDHIRFKRRIRELIKLTNAPCENDCGVVGSSPQIKKVIGLIDKFALSDLTVLLYGESGTGKELFAKAIHHKSKRREGPFVTVDCASLPETLIESELFGHEKGAFTGAGERKIGRFERAHGGTLFIDEIENLSLSGQAKLLRVIQQKQIERVGGSRSIDVDVRIVAATNTDIEQLIQDGRFREDLFYRFNQVTIKIPPLRERSGDVEILVHHFFAEYSKEFGRTPEISNEALDVLKTFKWPGNVRELENVVKSTAILADGTIDTRHLPEYLKVSSMGLPARPDERGEELAWKGVDEVVEKGLLEGCLDLKPLVKKWSDSLEEAVIRRVMERSRLNMNSVARFLNIDPKTLRSKISDIRGTKNPRGNRFPIEGETPSLFPDAFYRVQDVTHLHPFKKSL